MSGKRVTKGNEKNQERISRCCCILCKTGFLEKIKVIIMLLTVAEYTSLCGNEQQKWIFLQFEEYDQLLGDFLSTQIILVTNSKPVRTMKMKTNMIVLRQNGYKETSSEIPDLISSCFLFDHAIVNHHRLRRVKMVMAMAFSLFKFSKKFKYNH